LEKNISVTEASLGVKTLKAAGWDEISIGILQAEKKFSGKLFVTCDYHQGRI